MRSLALRIKSAACLLAAATGCADIDEPAIALDDAERPVAMPKVVGGELATKELILATVGIANTKTQGQHCTGTLVHPQVVVTAAHCLFDPETKQPLTADLLVVGAGEVDLRDVKTWHEVGAVIAHEGYGGNGKKPSNDPAGLTDSDDIGLLVLKDPVSEVPSAPIAPMASIDQLLVPNQPVYISGYGLNGADPQSASVGVLYIAASPYIRRSETEMLVGGPGSPDTCPGDSGGPVYAVSGNDVFLVGATSRGTVDASSLCGEGGIYTLVPAYVPWIESALAPFSGSGSGGAPGSGPGGVGGGAPEPSAGVGGKAPSTGDVFFEEDDDETGCNAGPAQPRGGAGALAVLAMIGLALGRARRRRPQAR
jgi:uncharacterized protein (TIGR03382 family)